MLIDDYYNHTIKDLEFYRNEIKKAENRLTSIGFMKGDTTVSEQLYNYRSEQPTQEFIGIVKGYDAINKLACIEQRNHFTINDNIEVVSSDKTVIHSKVTTLLNEELEPIDVARHPLETLYINMDKVVKPYDMIRRVTCKNQS